MGRASFLFMGDTGRETERALIDAGIDLESDVLKAGHHGSAASTSAELLEAVRPRIVLVSAGEGEHLRLPQPRIPGPVRRGRRRGPPDGYRRRDRDPDRRLRARGPDRGGPKAPGEPGLPFDTYD